MPPRARSSRACAWASRPPATDSATTTASHMARHGRMSSTSGSRALVVELRLHPALHLRYPHGARGLSRVALREHVLVVVREAARRAPRLQELGERDQEV